MKKLTSQISIWQKRMNNLKNNKKVRKMVIQYFKVSLEHFKILLEIRH